MTDKKEEKEIVVRAPSKPVTPPEKEAKKTAGRVLEEERFDVLEISRRIGTYFSASVLAAGSLLLFLFTYVTITGQVDWLALSSETRFLGIVLWIFVGLANTIGGFLLIGSE